MGTILSVTSCAKRHHVKVAATTQPRSSRVCLAVSPQRALMECCEYRGVQASVQSFELIWRMKKAVGAQMPLDLERQTNLWCDWMH